MRVSLLENAFDAVAHTVEVSWAELAAELTTVRRTPCRCHESCATCAGSGRRADGQACKACDGSGRRVRGRSNDCVLKNGSAWVPATFHHGKRAKTSVESVTVCVLDLDHLAQADLSATLDGVEAAGLAHIVHTTHSHRPFEDDCCARLVLPLSRPVTADDWPRLRESICSVFEIAADPKAKDPSRLFYLPSAPEGAEFVGYSFPGVELPVDEILKSAVAVPSTAPRPAAADVPRGPVDMDHVRESLKAIRNEENRKLAVAAMKGEPIAEEGARDDTVHRLASILAFNLPTTTPIDAMLEVVRPGVLALPGEPPPGMGSWVEMLRFKLERACADRLAKDEMRARFNAEVRARLGSSFAATDALARAQDPTTRPDEDISKPYPAERIEEWAKAAGCSTEEWGRRWIISKGTTHWVWREGRYLHPVSKDDLDVVLERDLARAPVTLKTVNEKTGVWHRRKTKEILQDYSSVARHIEARLDLQHSLFDPVTETFMEAVCPCRVTVAEENPRIQQWLEMLGGDQADSLLDWIATLTQLNRQTCALYLHAGPGIGKTLLATGLAKLWSRGGPSALEDALNGFNDTLTSCPLVFADEQLPPNLRHTTTILRKIIGQTVRPLNRKYMPTAHLHGAVRLILAANNDRLLETGEELTPEDLQAVAERFMYLDAVKRSDAIATFLREQVGVATINREWLDGDGIAKHALWLRSTRKVNDGGRFLVTARKQEFHERLVTASTGVGQTVEALVAALCAPPNSRHRQDERLLVGHGHLWVATAYLTAYWADFIRGVPCPPAAKLGRALANISTGAVRILTPRLGQVTYHRVRPEVVCSWAEKSRVADEQTIRDILASVKGEGAGLVRKRLELNGEPLIGGTGAVA